MLTSDPTLLPISTGPQWVTPFLPCCMTGFSCWRVRSPGKVFSTRFSTPFSSLLPSLTSSSGCWVRVVWHGGRPAGRNRSGTTQPGHLLDFMASDERCCCAIIKCMESCTLFLWERRWIHTIIPSFVFFSSEPCHSVFKRGLLVCSCSTWKHSGRWEW